jgi:hypothetical protein
MRPASPSLLVMVAFVIVGTSACVQTISDLSPDGAAAALRDSAGFTKRPDSPVRRELIEVVAVRRIGNSSTEVEFTWRDADGTGSGVTAAPVKTSFALFRLREREVSGLNSLMVRLRIQEPATWALSSLYKVH